MFRRWLCVLHLKVFEYSLYLGYILGRGGVYLRGALFQFIDASFFLRILMRRFTMGLFVTHSVTNEIPGFHLGKSGIISISSILLSFSPRKDYYVLLQCCNNVTYSCAFSKRTTRTASPFSMKPDSDTPS
ncbi:hypothetical protein Barb6_01813 [Bacteroidales bacterium Barb6]|nr:hypothetical protein Barb6_01813 [Bacteroidales bacterium Barb6]